MYFEMFKRAKVNKPVIQSASENVLFSKQLLDTKKCFRIV